MAYFRVFGPSKRFVEKDFKKKGKRISSIHVIKRAGGGRIGKYIVRTKK